MSKYGITLIVICTVIQVIIACLSTRYSKRKMKSEEHFFTGGRDTHTALMISTFIAYAVGTGLLFSPAESAYLDGLTAMLGYALAISLAYVFFVPVSRKIRERIPEGHTIGEYTKVRYGKFMHLVTLTTTSIYMFILCASNLTGASLAFKYMGGVPMILSVVLIGIPTIYFATQGGVNAAIYSNGLQSILMAPLLFVPAFFVLRGFGGAGNIYDGILEAAPRALAIFNESGLKFAIMIIIAVAAAELLNQTLWQRVYAAKDHKVLRRSLISSAVMILPLTVVAAFFGLSALATDIEVLHTSIVGALVIDNNVPKFVSLLFIIIIMLGASSTAGDALSGFSSIFSIDIIRFFKQDIDAKTSVVTARIGCILLGTAAMVVAYFAPSILFLLLLADLLASAAVVPVVAGLYSARISEKAAAAATIIGIIAGLPMFLAGNSFYSFLTALGCSSFIVLAGHLSGKKDFDFDRLKTEITNINDQTIK